MSYPPTKWYLSFISVVMLAVFSLLPAETTNAQASRARVEFAAVRDGQVVVHVSVPRGQTVEQANLTLDNRQVIELAAQPVMLPVNRWVLLDAGESVINTASTTQTAVEDFLRGTSDNERSGLIFYTTEITRYMPTSSQSDVVLYLEQFSASANTPGCVGEALAALAETERPFDRARRVLLIAGQLSRQGRCVNTGYMDVQAPVDIILVSNDVDDVYLDIVERSNGELLRANISTLDIRVNDMLTLWSQPVYSLSADNIDIVDGQMGELAITLANGSQQTFSNVVFTDYSSQETDAADNANGGLMVMPGSSPVPTQPPPPTIPPAVPTAPSAQAIAVVPTQPQAAAAQPTAVPPTAAPTQPAAIQPTSIATQQTGLADPPPTTIPPTIAPTQPNADTSAAPTVGPTSTSAPTSAAVADASTSAPQANDAPFVPGGSSGGLLQLPMLEDTFTLVGIGVIVVAMLIAGAVFIPRGPRGNRKKQQGVLESAEPGDETYIEPEITEIETYDDLSSAPVASAPFAVQRGNFYDLPEDDDVLDITEMVEDDEDDDKTEMIAEEDLIEQTIGTLTMKDTGQTYPISYPRAILGRKEPVDILITGDRQISRKHIEIELGQDGSVWLFIHTANPILRNGVRVHEPVPLNDGDELVLSEHTATVFNMADPMPPAPFTPSASASTGRAYDDEQPPTDFDLNQNNDEER